MVRDLDFSISYTTRAPRGSEINGRQYYFISRDEFEKMIRDDEFLEYAEVFGNYYGTARRFLREAEQKGNDLLLDIDVQGAEQISGSARRHQHLHSPSRSQNAGGAPAQAQRRSGRSYPAPFGNRHPGNRELRHYNYILVNDRSGRIHQISARDRARRTLVRTGHAVRGRSLDRGPGRPAASPSARTVAPILESFRAPAKA